MPDPTTQQRLSGLILSATELHDMTKWPEALVEDYLNIFENLVLIADILDVEIDQKLEEVPTEFSDGSIPYVDDGFLAEDNAAFSWDKALKKLTASYLHIINDLYISGEITNVQAVQFETGLSPAEDIAQLWYDDTHHTFSFKTALGNKIQIGSELGDVGVNQTGGGAEGKVVYSTGSLGHRMTFDFADAREGGKSSLVGVCTTSNGNNQEEFVTTFGAIHGIDTSAWAVDTKLYIAADATGVPTSTAPSAPNYRIWVATVIEQHATQGVMFVDPRLDFADGVTLDSLDVNNNVTVGGDLDVSGDIDGGFTLGSDIFQGAEGLEEDGANKFWDNTNKRQGIGTNEPQAPIHVNIPTGGVYPDVGSDLYSASDGVVLSAQGIGAGQTLVVASGNVNQRAVFTGTKSTGTLTSPGAVSSGHQTFSLIGGGYDGSSVINSGFLSFSVDDTVSTGVVPQKMEIALRTASGFKVPMTARSSGNVGINNQSPAYGLHSGSEIGMKELSADPTTPVEGDAVMWPSDGTATGDDGDVLLVNQANSVVIKRSLQWKDFNPSSVTVTTGTYISGSASDLADMFGTPYVVDEVSGTPGFDIRCNFTGIDRLPRFLVVTWDYLGGAGHQGTIRMYDYSATTFRAFRRYSDSNGYDDSMTMIIPLNLNGDLVDGSGNAIVQIYHDDPGNPAHSIELKYVGLTHSLQGVI